MRSFQEFKWLSTSFTEEEAKAVKKAFERVSLRKPQFMEDEWKLSKEKRRTMESNDEFMEYLKRNPEAIKDDFRRRTTVQCLDDYEEELARRRNHYKGCTKEFDILEERIKEIAKIANLVKEEMLISDVCKYFLGKEV
nr:MAG TPA: hypothetical protein [Caudoviricetes sp.]